MTGDMFGMAMHALAVLLLPSRLLVLFIGVVIGLAIGVLPGLTGIVGMALLIPFTYHMETTSAFALLLGMAAVITSSDFISAILFGVPGHVGAAATVIDGHAMARNGEAGRAFGAGFAASLAGGLIGAFVLFISIPILRPVLLAIGSPELLGFTLFGMSMVATLSGRSPLRGLAAAGIGLMLSMIGSDSPDGTLRWTFGSIYLYDGLPLVPVTLGLFALPELAELAVTRMKISSDDAPDISLSSQWEGVRDVGRNWLLVVKCSLIGTALGTIPGIGGAVIDWIAYGYAQRTEKNPERFGHGDVRGVIAPEASNNSKEGGHLVPTIAFGVPAGASMALLLAAFLIHGLTPGPEMLTKHLDITYSIVWSLTLAHIMGAIICLCASSWLARISRIPPEILLPMVLALVMIAAYQGSHDWGDLYCLVLFGIIGWFMKQCGWPRPPMVLGLVVGEIFERYLFISHELYGWNWVFRPVVMAIFVLIAWALFRPVRQIARDIAGELRHLSASHIRLSPHAALSLSAIIAIILAMVGATQWTVQARLVPMTAAAFALVTALLNLVNEVFGKAAEPATGDAVDSMTRAAGGDLPPALVRGRATMFFVWLSLGVGCIALIGFLPAIAVFVAAYMAAGFRQAWVPSLGYGLGMSLFCWVVFQKILVVVWPSSALGDFLPQLRDATGFL